MWATAKSVCNSTAVYLVVLLLFGMNLLIYLPMVLLILFFWYLWFSSWRSFGKPSVLKRTTSMAILMPIGYFVFDTLVATWLWISLETEWGETIRGSFSFRDWFLPFGEVRNLPFNDLRGLLWLIGFFLVFAIPFVCIFINARRYDKSIKLARSLMFWLPPQEGLAISNSLNTNSSKPTKKGGLFCVNCGETSQQGTKFCPKCGGKISE